MSILLEKFNPLKLLVQIIIITWCVMAASLAKDLVTAEVEPFSWILFFISLLGIASSTGWLFFSHRWKAILVGTTVLYLALYTLRFFSFLEFNPHNPIWQIIYQELFSVWSISSHALLKGQMLFSFEVMFHLWIMPLVQIVFLVILIIGKPLITRSEI